MERRRRTRWRLAARLLTALQSLFETDPASSRYVQRPTPALAADGSYVPVDGARPMRVYTWVDTRLMFEDFFPETRRIRRWQESRPEPPPPTVPRTIVTADPELDDLNSMIRFLLYSNEVQVEGLVYASSRFHWRGDGAGTAFFLPDREYETPQTSWRWARGRAVHRRRGGRLRRGSREPPGARPPLSRPGALRAVIRERATSTSRATRPPSRRARSSSPSAPGRPGRGRCSCRCGRDRARSPRAHCRSKSGTPAARVGPHPLRRLGEGRHHEVRVAGFDLDDYIAPHWPGIRVIEVRDARMGVHGAQDGTPRGPAPARCRLDAANVTSVGPLGALTACGVTVGRWCRAT